MALNKFVALAMAVAGYLFAAAMAQDSSLEKGVPSADDVPFGGVSKPVPHERGALPGLETFMDGAVAALREAHTVPGVTVAVVHDGQIALLKGYGYANPARTRPVDPATTLFRPASISKTITWTAVMQLVDQGLLDLDTDVNQYLTQFQIPETYPEPITLRHLLTHTGGFEDGGIGVLFVKNVEDVKPLAEALEATMPARVSPPGVTSVYSNWGTALAGLIVANQSGMDFETYTDRNIFEPLGMTHSTFREPVPEKIISDQSASFGRKGGEDADKGFEYVGNFAPAGGMSTTARDMARFMLAHLGDGSYEGGRILSPETTRLMREPLHRQHEAVNAMLYGFYEQTHNGRFGYGHGGDTIYFHSDMAMLPKEGVGIFVSVNSLPGSSLRTQLVNAFFDHYFPSGEDYPHPMPTPANDEAIDGTDRSYQDYVGAYRTLRRPYTTYEKALFGLTRGDTEIVEAPNGGLIKGGQRYIEESQDIFRSVDNPDDKLVFGRDEEGAVTLLFDKEWAAGASDKLGPLDKVSTHYLILGLGLFLSIGVVVGSLWGAPKWFFMSMGEKVSRGAVFGAALSYLGFVGGSAAASSAGPEELVYTGIPGLMGLLTLSAVSAALAVLAGLFLVPAWSNGYWSLFGRLRHTVVVIVLVAVAWSLHHWNLVGPWNA